MVTHEVGMNARQGCWTDRGTVPVFEGSANVCKLVNPASAVCAFTSELLSLSTREEECDSVVCVLCESCV